VGSSQLVEIFDLEMTSWERWKFEQQQHGGMGACPPLCCCSFTYFCYF